MQNATKSLCKFPLTLVCNKPDDGWWVPSEISFNKTTSCYFLLLKYLPEQIFLI